MAHQRPSLNAIVTQTVDWKGNTMGRLIRFLFLIACVAALGAVAYVWFVDVPPVQREIVQKVSNDVLFQK